MPKKKTSNIDLEAYYNKLNAKYGEGSIIDASDMKSGYLSSEILPLDLLIPYRGIPIGKLIQIIAPEGAGKSTLIQHIVTAFQHYKEYYDRDICIYGDFEFRFDIVYANKCGIDTSPGKVKLLHGLWAEANLEMIEDLMRSGKVKLVVMDSVPALAPKKEVENEMEDETVGLQAKLITKALRKLLPVAYKTDTTIIVANQIREKIGGMFGCLHGDVNIPLTDGRNYSIKEIVDNKIKGKVFSIDKKANRLIKKSIIGWKNNGKVEKENFITIKTEAIETKNGILSITCTDNHKILTQKGWKKAKDVSINDKVVSKYRSIFNNSLQEFIIGTLIGDSHIAIKKKTASINLQDNKNVDYIIWKVNKLKDLNFRLEKYFAHNKKLDRYCSKSSYELYKYKSLLGNRNPLNFIDEITPLSLAIWYMDDGSIDESRSHCRGSICAYRFKDYPETLIKISNKLFKEKFGVENKIDFNEGRFIFNKKGFTKLCSIIENYIPECMQYKLPKEFKGKYKDFDCSYKESFKIKYINIIDINKASDRKYRNKIKYDLVIKDTHNYLAGNKDNGFIIHNSNESYPGGRFLKHYSSLTLDLRKIQTLDKQATIKNKSRKLVYGQKVKIRIKKGLGGEGRELYTHIYYGKGINKGHDLLYLAEDCGVIVANKSTYFYGEDKLGMEKGAIDILNSDEKLYNEIKNKVVEIYDEYNL